LKQRKRFAETGDMIRSSFAGKLLPEEAVKQAMPSGTLEKREMEAILNT
jgi:hypothetical protein